jgi:peptidoglycan/LPS O-acetylase OafA/YrhL
MFLTISVVLIHTGPLLGLRGLPGDVALQAFFMVSGFYMTLVLTQKYVGPGSVGHFVRNRFLRLFPVYWIVALITLACLMAMPQHDCHPALRAHCFLDYRFAERYANLDLVAWTYLVLSNATMFGLDVALFLEFDDSAAHLSFTRDFTTSSVPVYSLLLIPQAWSLSVELAFYLVAPLIVRRQAWTVVVVLLTSVLLRWGIYGFVSDQDPWTYRFFPTELGLFALGILSCKAYLFHRESMRRAPVWLVSASFLGLSFIYQWWRLPGGKWTYFAIATLALPYLFHATRHSKLDSMIGDLTYPMYLVHILAIALLIPLVAGTAWELRLSWIALPATVGAAAVLWLLIGKPIEGWRRRWPVTGGAANP